MKKIISAFLLLSLVFTLFSCGKITYNEEDVKSAARELISKSATLDEIFWGAGISYIEDLNYSSGSYYMASALSLMEYGIDTIYDIETLAFETFSIKYATSSLNSVLGSIKDSESVYVLARYYQKYSDAAETIPECIMVNSKYVPLLTDKVEYLFDTIEVMGSDSKYIYISIEVDVSRGEKTERKTLSISLVVEDGKYKIDTPTYTTYTATDN